MYCAPSNKKTLPNSCYTNDQIINIAKSFNLYNKSNLINIEQSPIHIYNDLKIKLNNIREDLWLDNTENTKFLNPFKYFISFLLYIICVNNDLLNILFVNNILFILFILSIVINICINISSPHKFII